jgi:hypothetical protein
MRDKTRFGRFDVREVKMRCRALLVWNLVFAAFIAARASSPAILSYQGQLTDSVGNPITTTVTLRFTLLLNGTATENPSTGTPAYQEDVSLTPDSKGVFHHLIGTGTPTNSCDESRDGTANDPCVLAANDFPNSATFVFLEARVDPFGANNPLLPRHRISTIGYAMNAETVNGQGAPGLVSNLGVTLTAGTMTITDASGASLSVQNSGYVSVPSNTPGRVASLKITAPYSFSDDNNAASDLAGLGFGITETSNWSNDMPFFLYAVNRNNSNLDGADGHSAFFLSRSFAMQTTPSDVNDVGDTDAMPSNDSQDVIVLLGSYTKSNYVSLPCQLIGAMRMRWSSATADWTVQPLGNTDGIGTAQLTKTFGTTWVFPAGQSGASSGSFLRPNGGSVPFFSSQNFEYTIEPTGAFRIYVNLSGDGGFDGSGSVNTLLTVPYTIRSLRVLDLGWWIRIAAVDRPGGFDFSTNTNYVNINAFTVTGGQVNAIIDSPFLSWGSGDRRILGSAVFKAYR